MDVREPAASALTFGAWIQQRRKALDLTQDELARRVGCSRSTIRKIERDERRPSRQVAGLLAEHLRLPAGRRQTFLDVSRGQAPLDRLSEIPRAGPAPDGPPLASHLPAAPTPLVGREPELEALARLLADPACRLLTLVGPGGIGKTRLALEAALRARESFADGAVFVPLASLSQSASLVPAVADALGLAFSGPAEPKTQLLHALRGRNLLLVLDNMEHLLDAASLLAEALAGAPGVKHLVTSRERLNLAGEWVFETQGLPAPPGERVERAEDYSALALFVQSARRARAGRELPREEWPAAARICRLVQGLPLGLELAAAWTPLLSCAEIEREIERSLDFLQAAARDAPARQRSLRAAFEHSWNLLSAEERAVLSRLAVFQGGFERAAAEHVAGATLKSLSALVAKSLVRRSEAGRFDLHEVLRQYALAHLAADPAREAETRDRHADFFLALLREREQALKGAGQQAAVRELAAEIDNLRAAWRWAVEREKFAQLGDAARCLGWLCDMRGWLREGIAHAALVVQALRDRPEDPARERALGQALACQGILSFRLGQYEPALALFAESLRLLRPLRAEALLPDALILSGVVFYLSGEIDQAQARIAEGLALAQAAGDQWSTAFGRFNQGFVLGLLGRDQEACEQMRGGLALWRALGDPRFTALALNFLGPVAIRLGRVAEAQQFLEESLALCAEVGDRWGVGTALRGLGLAALARDDANGARGFFQQSLDLFIELDARWDIARSLTHLGDAEAALGAEAEAARSHVEALRLALEAQAAPLALEAVLGLAGVYARAGEAEQALELAAHVFGHRALSREAQDRAGRLLAELETRVTPAQAQAARARAAARTLESLAAEILARAAPA